MENHQISSVIMTRPKKTNLFAATIRQKKTLLLEGVLHQLCTYYWTDL
jgi:hypothetical protein